jgi:hypothetical protein
MAINIVSTHNFRIAIQLMHINADFIALNSRVLSHDTTCLVTASCSVKENVGFILLHLGGLSTRRPYIQCMMAGLRVESPFKFSRVRCKYETSFW